jgi:hypothetical protein
MKNPLIMMAFILVGAALRADDITTLRGEKFTNVIISRVEPDGIVVRKRDGIMKIYFSDLSPELRRKYGYDPEKAAELPAAEALTQQPTAQQQGEQTGGDAKAKEMLEKTAMEVQPVTPTDTSSRGTALRDASDKKQIRASLQEFLVEAEKLDAIAEQIVSLSFAYNEARNDYLAYGSKLGEPDKTPKIWSDLTQVLPQFDSQLRVAKTRLAYSSLPHDTSSYESFDDVLKKYQYVIDIWGDTDQRIAAAIKAKYAFKEAKERLERDLQ